MKGPSGAFCGSRTSVPCLDGRRPGCRTKKASGSSRPAAPQAGEKNKARCFAGCSRLYAGVEPAPFYVEGKNADHCCACLSSAPDRNRTCTVRFKGPVLCLLSYRRMAAPVRTGLTSSGSEPGVLPLNEGAVDGPGRSRTFIRRLTAARASVAAPAQMELPAGVEPASSVWRTEILNTAERRKHTVNRLRT